MSNLHRVWDSGLIDRKQLSYTEWYQWLSPKITQQQVDAWSTSDPLVYINESQALHDVKPIRSRVSIVVVKNRLNVNYPGNIYMIIPPQSNVVCQWLGSALRHTLIHYLPHLPSDRHTSLNKLSPIGHKS